MSVERRGRRPNAASQPINQLPWSQPQLTLEPARLLPDDQIEAIHRLSLQVLEDIGMDMLHP
jgi:trimethylamine--corrinoid protein Co-methyltransferase